MSDSQSNAALEAQRIEPAMFDHLHVEKVLSTGYTGPTIKELVARVSFGNRGNGALASVQFIVRVEGTQVGTTPYLEMACDKYNGLPAAE